MIKSKYKKESKLTFEIEPLTRVEALREGNKLKEDGKSNIVLYNQNDKTYSVFDKKHYDYLMDSNEVDMSQWKEIKQFEAPEENPDQGSEIVQKEPDSESNDNLNIDLNEPESSADNTSNITSDETTDEELNDENIEEENPEESEEDMNVEYNKTTPDEMEEIIKKENYNRRKINEANDKYVLAEDIIPLRTIYINDKILNMSFEFDTNSKLIFLNFGNIIEKRTII